MISVDIIERLLWLFNTLMLISTKGHAQLKAAGLFIKFE